MLTGWLADWCAGSFICLSSVVVVVVVVNRRDRKLKLNIPFYLTCDVDSKTFHWCALSLLLSVECSSIVKLDHSATIEHMWFVVCHHHSSNGRWCQQRNAEKNFDCECECACKCVQRLLLNYCAIDWGDAPLAPTNHHHHHQHHQWWKQCLFPFSPPN